MSNSKSWQPTKKWWAAAATGVGSILVHLASTDFTFGDTEQGMIAALVVALVSAYVKRNDPTAGGIPPADRA